jgi:hypothetical protein
MEIGKPLRIVIVEPVETPVPRERPTPVPERKEPAPAVPAKSPG